jgi:hypothetical protein
MRALVGVLLVVAFVLSVASVLLVRAIGGPPALAPAIPEPAALGPTVARASEAIHYPQCPADLQTPEQMAATIGGDPGDWTVPEGWWGAWTLRSADIEHLVWPGFGYFDTANMGMRLQHDVDSAEASFHCEEPPTT